nr:uncharacterized protein LOC127343332 [Lolium perenne]
MRMPLPRSRGKLCHAVLQDHAAGAATAGQRFFLSGSHTCCTGWRCHGGGAAKARRRSCKGPPVELQRAATGAAKAHRWSCKGPPVELQRAAAELQRAAGGAANPHCMCCKGSAAELRRPMVDAAKARSRSCKGHARLLPARGNGAASASGGATSRGSGAAGGATSRGSGAAGGAAIGGGGRFHLWEAVLRGGSAYAARRGGDASHRSSRVAGEIPRRTCF